MMLQEEYDHELKVILSLVAAMKHFMHTMTFDRYERPELDPNEVKHVISDSTACVMRSLLLYS